MVRRLGLALAALAILAPVGCRSIGRFPTIDPTDYAQSYFNGVMTQVYQFTPPQVESSLLQTIGDLGFKKIDRRLRDDGVVEIKAWTLDHRPSCFWIKPRNTAMTQLSVFIGLIGDEIVSATIMQRVAENFGTIPRVLIPIEPTLERRFNPVPPLQPTLPKVVTIPTTLPPEAVPLAEPSGLDADAPPTGPTPPPVPTPDPGPFGPSELPVPPPTPAPTMSQATPDAKPGS